MKKLVMILPLALVLCFMVGCTKEEQIERIMEDGVEVVINHLEPYKIEGEPTTLQLEELFTIDTERDEIAEQGLTDIGVYFDVDSQGNIYLSSYENADGTIIKFDRNGNFVCSFARKGQGPGELQARRPYSLYITIDHNDNIAVSDIGNKISVFGNKGDVLKETKITPTTFCAFPLANGNFLSYLMMRNGGQTLALFNSQYEEIKELEKQLGSNSPVKNRVKAEHGHFSRSVSRGKIFTGLPGRGYDINVYDFEGKLLRKIKKEDKPIPVTEEYKKDFMKTYEGPEYESFREKLYFPDSAPPYHSFFADDEGRLFVMTYKKGRNPGEYMYDIFNPEGVFIFHKSLKAHHDGGGVYAKVKKGRFYCLNEKENSFKELVVYKMKWE